MRAFVVKQHGTLEDIVEIELPKAEAGRGEVRIQVMGAAINPADLKVVSGKNGGKFIHSSRSPIRLGFDFSGVVDAVGPNVAAWKAGDEVYGFLPYSRSTRQGSFADYIVVKSDSIAYKPASVTHAEAATAPTVGVTAYQCLVKTAGIQPGQRVLINGATGGVGTYAVQIAKHYGAAVWGTGRRSSTEYLQSLGTDHVVDYNTVELQDLDTTFDIILDAADTSSFHQAYDMLTPGGIYIALLPSLSFVTGKVRSLFSSKRCAVCIISPNTKDLTQLAKLIDQEAVTTPVAATYPVRDIRQALERFELGGINGKIGIMVAI